jgi:predicted transcriptional regulator
LRMAPKTDTIEVDQATAEALRTRAAERGISVAEFLAEVASESAPVAASAAEIAELDRRWAKIEAGEPTIPNEDVVRWLHTWGTPEFKPWPER